MTEAAKHHEPRHKAPEKIDIGEPISQDVEIWTDVGRKLLVESIEVSREYAKFMIQFSLGAIPIYITLLGLVGKSTAIVNSLGIGRVLVVLSPVLLFMSSSLLFILAYYPKSFEMLVNVIETIQNSQRKIVNRRRRVNLIATSIFTVAVLLSAAILLTLL